MGKRAKLPRSKVNAKSNTGAAAAAKRTPFPDPPRGTVLNPDVNAEFKDKHLSVYGHRLMSNRDLRVVGVAQLLMDWASDDTQPDGVREGFPLNSVVGINLTIDDFEAVSRRYTEDSEDAFTIFAHEWKWRPPVLKSFNPMEIGQWELEVYDILYNYCLRPLEYNSLTMNQFIAWLCSNGSVPKSFRTRVEKECLSRGGIKYSEFLEIIKAYCDAQPEEIARKQRLREFFAKNEPPRLQAIGLEEFDQYKRDVIKVAQTNRDILLLWDEQFVFWLSRGFHGYPELAGLIGRRAFELAIRLDETRPPSCKAVNLLFGDLLVVMEDYINREHARQNEVESESEESEDEAELEIMLNEILHNEREIYYERAEIHKRQAEDRGTDEDNRRLYLLDQREDKCANILRNIRQAQERRKMKFEQAIPRSIVFEVLGTEEPIAQMMAAKDIVRRASSNVIASSQQHYTHMPYFRLSRPNSPEDNSDGADYDSDYERQQRCRMAEIRRQRLTRRTR
ncbi:hypothetical protein E4T52_04189 [Aureobasidium sp. EXF-3400]|nr:hypothetical protein E4T51_03115 [Aureobasidium sp. EXF-12344]KAI4780903.1 hypothetical protein E4T52_04189 [Aureobasidium sp. EXF-3400]